MARFVQRRIRIAVVIAVFLLMTLSTSVFGQEVKREQHDGDPYKMEEVAGVQVYLPEWLPDGFSKEKANIGYGSYMGTPDNTIIRKNSDHDQNVEYNLLDAEAAVEKALGIEPEADTEEGIVFVRDGDIHILNPGDGSVEKITSNGCVSALDVAEGSGNIYYATFDYSSDLAKCSFEKITSDGSEHEVITSWEGGEEPVVALSVSPSEDTAYFSFNAHQVSYYWTGLSVLDVGTKKIEPLSPVKDDQYAWEYHSMPAVSPSGDKLASIHAIGEIPWNESGGIFPVYLCVMDTDGQNARDIFELPVEVEEDRPYPPCWSPDGSRIAFVGENCQVWSVSANGTDPNQLTSIGERCLDPDWSADGGKITFSSHAGDMEHWFNPGNIYSVPSTGGEAELLTDKNTDLQPHWTEIEIEDSEVNANVETGGIVFVRDGNVLVHNPETGDEDTIYSGGDALKVEGVSPDGEQVAVQKEGPDEWTSDYVVINVDGSGSRPLYKESEVPENGGFEMGAGCVRWDSNMNSVYFLGYKSVAGGILFKTDSKGSNLQEVENPNNYNFMGYDLSDGGRIAFVEKSYDSSSRARWSAKLSDLDGSNEVVIEDDSSGTVDIAISPDGKNVIYKDAISQGELQEPSFTLCHYDVDSGSRTSLATVQRYSEVYDLAQDGKRFTYTDDGTIYIGDLSGGQTIAVCEGSTPYWLGPETGQDKGISGFVFADVPVNGEYLGEYREGMEKIEGAKVILQDVSGKDLKETETNNAGRYGFEGVEPGEYRLKVDAMSYYYYQAMPEFVKLEEGDNLNKDLPLIDIKSKRMRVECINKAILETGERTQFRCVAYECVGGLRDFESNLGDVEITARIDGGSIEPEKGLTPSQGFLAFTYSAPQEEGRYLLSLWGSKEGYQDFIREVEIPVLSPDENPISIDNISVFLKTSGEEEYPYVSARVRDSSSSITEANLHWYTVGDDDYKSVGLIRMEELGSGYYGGAISNYPVGSEFKFYLFAKDEEGSVGASKEETCVIEEVAWGFDNETAQGVSPAGWVRDPGSVGDDTFDCGSFEGRDCLHIWTSVRGEGEEQDRVKLMTEEQFGSGIYEWCVHVPDWTEEGVRGEKGSIGAFLYNNPGGEGNDREIDFEIGYGQTEPEGSDPTNYRELFNIPEDQLTCFTTVQRDKSTGTDHSWDACGIDPGWYKLRIVLENCLNAKEDALEDERSENDYKYRASWWLRKDEKPAENEWQQIGPISDDSDYGVKTGYGPPGTEEPTRFPIICSLEILNFSGDKNPVHEKNTYFDFVKFRRVRVRTEGDVDEDEGDDIAYLKEGDIHISSLDGSNDRKVTERGDIKGFTGTPSGDRWAYLTDDAFFISDSDGNETRVSDPVEYNGYCTMAFSPDGRKLLLSKVAREIHEDRAVWGFFSCDAESGAVTPLVEQEVAFGNLGDLSFGPDGKEAYYTEYASDPGARTIWKLTFSGTDCTKVTDRSPYMEVQETPGGTVAFSGLVYSSSGAYRCYVQIDHDSFTEHIIVEDSTTGDKRVLYTNPEVADQNLFIHYDNLGFSPSSEDIIYYEVYQDARNTLYSVNHSSGEESIYNSITLPENTSSLDCLPVGNDGER